MENLKEQNFADEKRRMVLSLSQEQTTLLAKLAEVKERIAAAKASEKPRDAYSDQASTAVK